MNHTKIDLSNIVLSLDFLKDTPKRTLVYKNSYKVIIADDDEEIHKVTKMILGSFDFEGRNLKFIDAYSGKETMDALMKNPDTAVVFLDVVMEENQSGLKVIDYLRRTIGNRFTRVILRTGQPGQAPEDEVIRNYDINDYLLKTELTVNRLNTSMFTALRSYRDIMMLERHRRGLEEMIKASSDMFKQNSMSDFLNSILNQVSSFYQSDIEMLFIREAGVDEIPSGFILSNEETHLTIIAAKGRYERYIGKNLDEILALDHIYRIIHEKKDSDSRLVVVEGGLLIKQSTSSQVHNYIFIEGTEDKYKLDLINLFLNNYSLALDNFYLNKQTTETQTEMISTLGEVIEAQFQETSGHVKRITVLIYRLAQRLGLSDAESECIKIASALHDVGKIGIPNTILKKPALLTEEEMSIMQSHTRIGYTILSKSNLPVLQMASEIALHHHERFDGLGYPDKLVGKAIARCSRMMAIVDVFDAITNKRVYKDASPREEALRYITEQRGKHFDPEYVDAFLSIVKEL